MEDWLSQRGLGRLPSGREPGRGVVTNQVEQAGWITEIGDAVVKGTRDPGRKERTVQLSNSLGSRTRESSNKRAVSPGIGRSDCNTLHLHKFQCVTPLR